MKLQLFAIAAGVIGLTAWLMAAVTTPATTVPSTTTASADMTGQAFTATLTKLDGSKLTLPDDLKGKVVVLDFWATWCGPCVSAIPHVKDIYAKYKDQGVEFVGISLDRAQRKDDVAKFVQDHGMDWIHTYSGMYWNDPTARTYGIDAIPSVWVIGKDGKVVSVHARGDLDDTIQKALKG